MTDARTDERVDELLADLDRALAVEPSPALAARARTRMGAATSAWLGWRWSLAAGAVIVLAGAAYFAWPQPSAVRSTSAQVVPNAPATPGAQPSAQVPSQAASPVAAPAVRQARARAAGPNPVRHATAEVREPEVLISPNQRIALEQLAAALKDGRLTTESVAAANQPIVQEPLIVPSMIIAPFEADVLPAIGTNVPVGTGGGVIRRLARVVAGRPFSFPRSQSGMNLEHFAQLVAATGE